MTWTVPRSQSTSRAGSMPRISSRRQPVPRANRTKRWKRGCSASMQLRLFVEGEHARPRLVLAALDAAERVAEVVALVDGALEDGLQQPALSADGALGDRPPILVTGVPGQVRPAQVQVADDVRLRDLVERARAEEREEVRDDLRVAVPRRLLRRVCLAIDVPPLSEARDRALPSVHARADVVLDLRRSPFGGLLVGEPRGLAEPLAVDHLAEVPDAAALHQSHASPPWPSSDRAPRGRTG